MIILRQKEYTSLGRKIGAKIGRGRVNIADRLGNYMQGQQQKMWRISNSLQSPHGSKNHFKDLVKEAHDNYGARVMKSSNLGIPGSYAISDKKAYLDNLVRMNGGEQQLNSKLSKKVQNSLRSDGTLILADNNMNDAFLAHEIGHLKNAKLKRWFNRRANNVETRKRLNQAIGTSGIFEKTNKGYYMVDGLKEQGLYDSGIGLKESFKRFRDNNAIIKEEQAATKHGLDILKSKGASKEELRDAKNTLDAAGKTYKLSRSISVLSPIQNKIQIPSRRRV